MNEYAELLNKKAGLIIKEYLGDLSFDEMREKVLPDITGLKEPKFAAFISVCSKETRAKVFRAADVSPERAWNSALDEALKFVSSKSYRAEWVKADIICRSVRLPLQKVIDAVKNGYHEFFRRGIAFDNELKVALIEAEMNGSRVISYKKGTIELTAVNKYLSANGINTLSALPENVLLFDCTGIFCDENCNVYRLYDKGLDRGRRVIDEIDKDILLSVIKSSSEYLSMQIDMDGKFEYGFYPIFDKLIPDYNIMRHSTSIWSLICAYRITKDKFTLSKAESAIVYMLKNMFRKYSRVEAGKNTAYLIEKTQNEVKVGGNAVAIIMLTEYMNATGTDIYNDICVELGNGILELFDWRKGSFFHVLNYPSLAPKDAYRTVYYDGESVFALCRLYGITKDEKWLNAATLAVNRFIRENYAKHRDHWVAYAMNEITKYRPEGRYFDFALKNVQDNLDIIYNQKTSYHTYLELLCVTYELYERMQEKGIKTPYSEKFSADRFIKTIFRRAEHMLNGYCYPEYVMYFKYPEKSLGAFFVRHDGYRIRIDDVQHFCGAYYSLYRNYEKLDALRRRIDNQ